MVKSHIQGNVLGRWCVHVLHFVSSTGRVRRGSQYMNVSSLSGRPNREERKMSYSSESA